MRREESRKVPARSRPKIVFLTRRLDIGGAQRQLVELALGLHAAGWRVVVATFYDGGALASRLVDAGVATVSVGKRGRWDVLGFAARLLRLLRRERADIVHGYLEMSNVLLALLRPLLGCSRVVWGVRASNMDLTKYDGLAAFESRLGRALARRADLIICNSEAGRSYHVARGYPAQRVVVIPNGVDVQRFAPDEGARRALRAEWGIASDEVLLGVVARLDPMKDHRSFLAAAARVAATHGRARFVCVGDGPAEYRDALHAEASRLGLRNRVLWPGARNDMRAVYNALDVAVSSSSYGEGFSNSIVEAMATGVPCVVTDVGDSAAIVGSRGWVSPPADSAALADAMTQAIGALPADAKGIREQVCTAYSSANLLERTIAELEPLLGGRAPLVRTSIGGTNEF